MIEDTNLSDREVFRSGGAVDTFVERWTQRMPFVFKIEKPKESYSELYKLAVKEMSEVKYEVRKGIVSCDEIATSISPYAFNQLSEREKMIVAKFP